MLRANSVSAPMGRYHAGGFQWSRIKLHLTYLARLLADRVAPALFFVLFLAAKGPQLPVLLGPARDVSAAVRWQGYAGLAGYGLTCVFLLLIISMYVVRRPASRKERDPWKRLLALGATAISVAIGVGPARQPNMVLSLSGGLVVVAGLGIALAGLIALHRNFAVLPEVRSLVTIGLYRYVRHPMYLGEGLACLGIALQTLSPLSISILTACLVLQWRRALNEEAFLTANCPEYGSYAEKTKQFVPFLW